MDTPEPSTGARPPRETVWELPLTTSHPAGAGGLRLRLQLDGSRISSADPIAGRMHRGAEKLFESRDYRAALALANRHDWLSAYGSELGLAELLESMLGIEVPARAAVLRVLVAELCRIGHHLLWVSATLAELDHGAAAAVGNAAREDVLALLQRFSGARMHLMVVVVGGLRADVDQMWLRDVLTTFQRVSAAVDTLAAALDRARSVTTGVGILPTEVAVEFAASGPVARAAGVPLDLRIDRAGPVNRQLRDAGVLRRVVRSGGDAAARLEVLAEETRVSADCVQFCAEELLRLPPGPVGVTLPKVLRVPEGRGYGSSENPSGINGWYLISRGEPTPYRLKLRTASFNNAQTLPFVLAGSRLADLPLAMMTYLLIAGDIDK
jgi:NADH-quinone oxidoreductase subunit D